MPRTYVLVHGAWHGGWVWRDVVPALRSMGHAVTAPTLTGLGERKHLSSPEVGLGTHVEDVVSHVEMEDLRDVVLVGWSYGGMVIAGVLARTPDRVASMVYIDAFVPENGKSLVDYLDPERRERILGLSAKGEPVPPVPPAEFGVADQAVVDFITPRLAGQPSRCMTEGVAALAAPPNGLPHTFIRCTGYASVPLDGFYRACRADPDFAAHGLPASHVCMLSDPAETAELLANAG
jgi:pimeloyl-ACP methyl ester carboxylesterase